MHGFKAETFAAIHHERRLTIGVHIDAICYSCICVNIVYIPGLSYRRTMITVTACLSVGIILKKHLQTPYGIVCDVCRQTFKIVFFQEESIGCQNVTSVKALNTGFNYTLFSTKQAKIVRFYNYAKNQFHFKRAIKLPHLPNILYDNGDKQFMRIHLLRFIWEPFRNELSV